MKKIKNLKLENTEISEAIKWAELDSKIASLLKETDFIFLEDSEIHNKEEWKIWRQKVRRVKKNSGGIYGSAISILKNLEEQKPVLIKKTFDSSPSERSISLYKKDLIETVKRRYNRELLKQLVESGQNGLFDLVLGVNSVENARIANSLKFSMDVEIQNIESTNSITELEKINRKYNGY
jgi:hypothetical protein